MHGVVSHISPRLRASAQPEHGRGSDEAGLRSKSSGFDRHSLCRVPETTTEDRRTWSRGARRAGSSSFDSCPGEQSLLTLALGEQSLRCLLSYGWGE
ncbi:hypothetical protein [Alloactinosynnema sp. L-07]|nr:hypothetical protein [Alloactinosynnema sp. L-07]